MVDALKEALGATALILVILLLTVRQPWEQREAMVGTLLSSFVVMWLIFYIFRKVGWTE